jgi:hypothetical protein
MKTEAEQRFQNLMKETIENTDFEDDLKKKLKELGYDKAPDIEALQKRAQSKKRERKGFRSSRQLKIAGFVLAVFVVSSAMTIFWNSDVALASRFAINNFIFSVQNGFLATDSPFNSTLFGQELIIEDEEQITVDRNFLRELKIPEYIPDGYNFSFLRITNNSRNEYNVLFLYESDENSMIMIGQETLSPHNAVRQIVGIEKEFFIDGMRVLYIPGVITENNAIFVFTSSDLIHISGSLDLDELLTILEKLK